jgi:hypothetical protein
MQSMKVLAHSQQRGARQLRESGRVLLGSWGAKGVQEERVSVASAGSSEVPLRRDERARDPSF